MNSILEEIEKRIALEYDDNQIYYIYKGLKDELDISHYDNIAFDANQMEQIYLGLLHGIDTTPYENIEFSPFRMATIRIAIETSSFSDEMLCTYFTDYEALKIRNENHFGVRDIFKQYKRKEENIEKEINIKDEELDDIDFESIIDEEDTDEVFDLDFFVNNEIQNEDEEELDYILDDYEYYYDNFEIENKTYFNNIAAKYHLLTAEEEKQITTEIYNGENKSKERFILSNFRLVLSVAKKFKTKLLEFDDIVMAGYFGLLTAVERFDPNLGNKFSTYAIWWIRQSIYRYIADNDSLIRYPVHFYENISKYMSIKRKFMEDADPDTCTYEDYVKAGFPSHIKKNTFYEIKFYGDEERIVDIDDYTNDIRLSYPEYKYTEINSVVEEMLSHLSLREEQVLKLRFGFNNGRCMTLEEVGKEFNVTRERIRQIEAKALRKLKNPTICKKAKEYLDECDSGYELPKLIIAEHNSDNI